MAKPKDEVQPCSFCRTNTLQTVYWSKGDCYMECQRCAATVRVPKEKEEKP